MSPGGCRFTLVCSFSFDRRSDRRMYRINLPRVSLTGTVQPEILQRVLTQDFFDRGLPARILFAHPPFKKCETKWTNAEVDEKIETAVFELFDELWSLQPDKDDYNEPCPRLLRLDPEARVRFIEHFNQCGRDHLGVTRARGCRMVENDRIRCSLRFDWTTNAPAAIRDHDRRHNGGSV